MTTNSHVVPAVLVNQLMMPKNQAPMQIALFAEDGTPITDLADAPLQTGAQILLTGYSAGTWSAVVATDTVNEAVGKLATLHVASNVVLTGYAIGSAAALAATDSVMAAFAKLEKRIADLEAA
jgi:hypothetical protein